jgi:hypothetical protein
MFVVAKKIIKRPIIDFVLSHRSLRQRFLGMSRRTKYSLSKLGLATMQESGDDDGDHAVGHEAEASEGNTTDPLFLEDGNPVVRSGCSTRKMSLRPLRV